MNFLLNTNAANNAETASFMLIMSVAVVAGLILYFLFMRRIEPTFQAHNANIRQTGKKIHDLEENRERHLRIALTQVEMKKQKKRIRHKEKLLRRFNKQGTVFEKMLMRYRGYQTWLDIPHVRAELEQYPELKEALLERKKQSDESFLLAQQIECMEKTNQEYVQQLNVLKA